METTIFHHPLHCKRLTEHLEGTGKPTSIRAVVVVIRRGFGAGFGFLAMTTPLRHGSKERGRREEPEGPERRKGGVSGPRPKKNQERKFLNATGCQSVRTAVRARPRRPSAPPAVLREWSFHSRNFCKLQRGLVTTPFTVKNSKSHRHTTQSHLKPWKSHYTL